MGQRSHYLPSNTSFANMSRREQGWLLDSHLVLIQMEIECFTSGYFTYQRGGKQRGIALAKARRGRLFALAIRFGFSLDDGVWVHEQQKEKAKAA